MRVDTAKRNRLVRFVDVLTKELGFEDAIVAMVVFDGHSMRVSIAFECSLCYDEFVLRLRRLHVENVRVSRVAERVGRGCTESCVGGRCYRMMS